VDEYLCLTVVSRAGESEPDFSARLSRFWTHMLRNFKSDFEKVYAETTCFEQARDRLSRMYLFLEEVRDLLEKEVNTAGIEYEPIDPDEVYSKYEASPPEWMQIEH
jgi:hypothetical protein